MTRVEARRIVAPRGAATGRTSTVTVDADNLTQVDLALDPGDRPAACGEVADVGVLGLDMVELQHQWVGLSAIDARMALQVSLDESTRGDLPARTSRSGLDPVLGATLGEVA
jgi:hypothetical protein